MADILVDYASPVELTTLTGLSTLPGGHVTVAGERILVYGEADTDCGIWVVVSGGAWTRATDFDASSEVVFNQQIVPQSDDGANGIQAGSVFYVSTTGTITPGTTAFSITQRTYEEVQTPGVGIVKVGSDWQQSTTGIIAGSYDRVTVDERGNATSGSSSETETTFIEGLKLVWLTNTSFRVEEGAAYINGTGSIVDLAVDTDIAAGTKGLPSTFAANTWYYVYLYSNAGVGDIEVSTTAPVTTPYRGTAREKGGPDNTRRFIGALRATSTTVLARFTHNLSDNSIYYGVSVVQHSALTATTFTARSLATMVPPTSTRAYVWFFANLNASVSVNLDVSNATTQDLVVARTSQNHALWLSTDSSQQIYVKNNAASGATDVQTLGYGQGR